MQRSLLICVIFFFLFVTTAVAEQPVFEDAFSPKQGATALVVKTIGAAKRSIHVAAYSFTSMPIASALATAYARGIDVEVVLDKSQGRERHSLLPFLWQHHIPARINSRYAIMHDKFMVVDGQTIELGSFNYTTAAEKRNAENVLVIHDKKIAADYERQWRKLWGEAKED